jgi:hypothetical protein
MNALISRLARTFLFLVAAVLAGCGGGGEGGVGTGGTGTYAAGTITGFGSVIVNGIRFDDSSASVIDDDDAPRGRDALKLGMTVAIDSDAIRSDATGRSATARRIRLGSEILGPVSAVDIGAGTLALLGQTVHIGPSTVFDAGFGTGLGGVRVGQAIEVYGQFDAATGRYDASRIEAADTAAPSHLRGPVAAVDATQRQLRIGALTLGYAAASNPPATLAVGDIVRVRVRLVAGPFGGWVVDAFGTGVRTPDDRDEAELEGRVTSFASTAQFSINGVPVDASAARFPDGSAGVRAGALVEVSGSLRGGVLIASEVSLEDEDDDGDRGFELKGRIEAVDSAARTFSLRGNVVSWARSDLRLDGGTLADIAVGREVEVRALLASDRVSLEATRIEFD